MKLEEKTPPAIVIRHEAIEGVAKLAAAIAEQYAEQRKHQDKADAHGLEIGRMVCEFAEHKDVKAQLAIERAKRPVGRPKEAHCFVAEIIAEQKKSPVTERHLERCARAFLRAKKHGLPMNTPIRAVEATAIITKVSERNVDEAQPSPERLFPPPPDNSTDKEPFDPDKEASKLARTIKSFFYTDEGHPRLRTKEQKNQFVRKLQEQFEILEIDWEIEITPKGKE